MKTTLLDILRGSGYTASEISGINERLDTRETPLSEGMDVAFRDERGRTKTGMISVVRVPGASYTVLVPGRGEPSEHTVADADVLGRVRMGG